MEEREDRIAFPEADEQAWRQYLAEFKSKVWPMFEAEGFTLPQAILAWRQEYLITQLVVIRDVLSEGDT